MPSLVVSGLRKEFAGTPVLHDIDFTVEDGEFFTLLGPSGCGKSTTLTLLAGLEKPTAGSIVVGDTVFADDKVFVPAEERNLGMVFQTYALWPHMTVEQNLAVALKLRRVPRGEQTRLIAEALDKVGLAHLTKRYPHELSGGQQQRVALARAIVYSPRLLLLDEPLSNLDAKLREQARVWLKRMQQELGITTIYVTHDQEEALTMSDRIAVMSEGDMVQIAPPEDIYRRPATASIAAFIGRMNFLDGTLDADDTVRLAKTGDVIKVPVTDGLSKGQSVVVAFRPESAVLLDGEMAVPAHAFALETEVLTTSFLGARYEYDLRYGGSVLRVDAATTKVDGRVTVAVDRAAVNVFPADESVRTEIDDLVVA